MNENYQELRQVILDFLEDGILMGCTEDAMRDAIRDLTDTLVLDF